MSDLIKREDAIKALYKYSFVSKDVIEREINAIPSADRPQTSDLINGAEMLKRLHTDLCYGIACKDCSMCTEDGGCRVEEWIDTFPSADRPQGEWVRTGRTNIYGGIEVQCSNCEDKVMVQHLEDEWYCRHCGADMGMKGADDE